MQFDIPEDNMRSICIVSFVVLLCGGWRVAATTHQETGHDEIEMFLNDRCDTGEDCEEGRHSADESSEVRKGRGHG